MQINYKNKCNLTVFVLSAGEGTRPMPCCPQVDSLESELLGFHFFAPFIQAVVRVFVVLK